MHLKISVGESIVERFPTTTSIKPSNGELQPRLMDDCHGPNGPWAGPTLRNVIQYVPSSTCTGATAHLSKKKKSHDTNPTMVLVSPTIGRRSDSGMEPWKWPSHHWMAAQSLPKRLGARFPERLAETDVTTGSPPNVADRHTVKPGPRTSAVDSICQSLPFRSPSRLAPPRSSLPSYRPASMR
jgi:hypothetical protein